MVYITITDRDLDGTVTYNTKTVSEAWELGRIIMSNNQDRISSVEIINDHE